MLGKHADNLFLEETIKVWQPLADKPLTLEDAREIIHNVTGFFELLNEWDKANEK